MSNKQELKLKQKERDEQFLEERDLTLRERAAVELYLIDRDTLPKEFVVIFTNARLDVQLQKGYEILKQKVKKTKEEMNLYLTGAALSAGYASGTIQRCMPDELKDAVKAASGRAGGKARGMQLRSKRELREISHYGGIGGSPASKSLANAQMQLQKSINRAMEPSSKEVKLRINTKHVDLKECIARLEEGIKKGKDIELSGEDGGYVDLKKGFKLVTPL